MIDSPRPLAQALPMILFVALTSFVLFTGRVIFSPLMVTVEADMGFTHAKAGIIFLSIALGGTFGLLTSGFITARITHRRAIAISALASGLTLVAASLAPTHTLLTLAMGCAGFAAGIYFPSGMTSVTAMVEPKHWGKTMSIMELAPNAGFMVAPFLVEAVLSVADWRMVPLVLGVIQISIGLSFARFGTAGPFKSPPPKLAMVRDLVRLPAFWALIFSFCVAVAAAMAPFVMLPLYLTSEHGYSREAANSLLALSRFSGLIMAFVSGWLADRFGVRPTLRGYFILSSLATISLGLTSGWLLTVVVFIQPVIAAAYFPAAFTVISQTFDAKTRSMAFALITPAGVLFGQGLAPALIGYLGDHQLFQAGFIGTGLLLIIGLPLLPIACPKKRAP